MTDEEGHMLEAAQHMGAYTINDDADVYIMTEASLLTIMKAMRLTGVRMMADPKWDKVGEREAVQAVIRREIDEYKAGVRQPTRNDFGDAVRELLERWRNG